MAQESRALAAPPSGWRQDSFAAPDYRAHPPPIRSFISQERLHGLLSHRLGCRPTGERDLYFSYWLAPDGRRFRVLDAIVYPVGRASVAPGGRRQQVYSVDYARALVRFLLTGRHASGRAAA